MIINLCDVSSSTQRPEGDVKTPPLPWLEFRVLITSFLVGIPADLRWAYMSVD